jgi:steroid delta-isomerase
MKTTDNTDAKIRHIHEGWHKAIVSRDVEALMALYAEDAIFETPLVLATLKEKTDGVLRGKARIRPYFEASLGKLPNALSRWHRSGSFFSNGRQLSWEYPRETPQGDQIDLVEVMDIAGGLISHHRVYWGWVGFQALVAAMGRQDT